MPLEVLAPETRNFIDGALVEGSTGNRFENINPATGASIGTCADGTAADMETAIAAARRAFDETDWSTNAPLRAKCLRQIHEGLQRETEQLRAIVTAEAGSPVALSSFMQIDGPIEHMGYWADKAAGFEPESEMSDIPFFGQQNRRILRREAVGVVGAITPWNVPLYLNIAKIGPALASGCTAILKPAPDTPWSATHLGKILAQTDLPRGVLNIVASADHMVGEALSTDPRIDLVTFTGSTATGKRIMSCAADTVKKVFLELGGKSASIVLDDANLDAVLPQAAMSCIHGGQGCAITTRWLVPRARYEEALVILEKAFTNWKFGDPTSPAHMQGPQVSRRQQERVLAYIEQGKADGARLVCGGAAGPGPGFYVQPTLFADVDPASTIAQEEIFGPVCCVIPFDDDDDAVRIANDSVYGLSGAIHSGSEERALDVARRIRTGTIALNGGQWFHVDTPFGGYKQSGLGRENGQMGFEEYLETKVMSLPPRS